MSPDVYLHVALIFVSYFVKVGIAFLLCWLLTSFLGTPRQKFGIWLGFMVGSAAYWVYEIASLFFLSASGTISTGSVVAAPAARITRQFLLPLRFEHFVVILGRGLICAYVAGVVVLLLRWIRNRVRLHFLLNRGEAPSGELQRLFAAMCREFSVKHCDLVVLPEVNSPATVYWWRPRIILPRLCRQLDDSALMGDVLYHELAHVARRDYLWSSINDLACWILFFHPGLWQARKHVQLQREIACDLAVVAVRPEHRADYADTLTRVARLCLPRKSPATGIDFASAPSLLTHRVRAILSDPQKNSWIMKFSRAAAGLALAGAYAFLCARIAVAVTFAPSVAPQPLVDLPAAEKPLHHSSLRRAVHRPSSAAEPESEAAITESPAYRLRAADGYSINGRRGWTDSAASNELEGSEAKSPNWSAPTRPPIHPAGGAIQSVIMATVGSVMGTDKDDHSKHKDSSHEQRLPHSR